MNRILKELSLTCPECRSAYQLLEIHQQEPSNCPKECLSQWKTLLHQHYQEQIILFLAAKEVEAEAQTETQNHAK